MMSNQGGRGHSYSMVSPVSAGNLGGNQSIRRPTEAIKRNIGIDEMSSHLEI
jgi:hypothetical protein